MVKATSLTYNAVVTKVNQTFQSFMYKPYFIEALFVGSSDLSLCSIGGEGNKTHPLDVSIGMFLLFFRASLYMGYKGEVVV